MSSFISNFKQEAAVVCVVVIALCACELGLRATIARASKDVRHIEELPRIADGLASARKPTVLFLGNSLTRAGVLPDALGLDGAHVALIHPDDTTIGDWLYLYERYVRARGAAPDLVVVGFAADQLSDAPRLDVPRLGGYLGGLALLPQAFDHDVRDADGRTSYLLAWLSTAYANRERVRTEVLARLIPHYKTSAQRLNRLAKAQRESAPARRGYGRLARFLETFKGTKTKVVFAAFPVPAKRELDPELAAQIARGGGRLVDLRSLEGLTDRDFPDGYHLSPRGGAVLTRALARRVREMLGK